MRFSTILSGVVALASLAFAQTTGPNPFQIPAKGYLLTAGQPTTFNWQPTTQGTITLLLKAGPNGNLATILTIASNIPNSGSYTWTPDAQTIENNSYAIEIISDSDPTQVNFTPQFIIQSTVKGTLTLSYSSASATGSTTTGSASTATASTTITTTISSSGSAVSTSTGTVTGSSAASSGQSSATTTASASVGAQSTTAPTGNAAPAVRAGGALLAMAMGAIIVL